MKTRISVAGGVALLAAVILASAAQAQTARCCQSDKGPDPVAYTGNWLDGLYTRDKCVSVRYGFWAGDTPNEAKKVCAIRSRAPEDPVPPPEEEHRGG